MPKGYELNYYDTYRAIQRKIYSAEIKRFSSILKKCKFRNPDVYAFIISNINKGVYENLDTIYYRTQKTDNVKDYIGFNKSSYDQDFMSPMELRMNSIAVRKAINNLLKAGNLERLDMSEIEDICYMAGQSVAHDFRSIIQGENELNMSVKKPVLSAKPILKKYSSEISKGTIPSWKTYEYDPAKSEERKRYVALNKEMFFKIKEQLIGLGLTDATARQQAFGRLNEGYYFMEDGKSYLLEISKILISNKMDNFVSLTELKMNYEKLSNAYETLKGLPKNSSQSTVFKELKTSGAKTRQCVIRQYRHMPELFGGFYCTYADSDKRITLNQESIKKQNEQKDNALNNKGK